MNWKFKWLWLYGFVRPQTGETYWWILPFVNTELFNRVLADFAAQFGLGPNKHILLAEDPRRMAYKQKVKTAIRVRSNTFTISLARITTC